MSFTQTDSTYTASKFSKIDYLKLNPGTWQIRILQTNIDPIFTHFVLGKYSIACLGEDCPICASNKKIIFENPTTFKDVSGYSSKTRRYVFNVMDRNLYKICPQCQNEIPKQGKDFPGNCSKCGAFITGVTPTRPQKVKLVNCGVTLAGDINNIEKAMCDVEGEPLGYTNYDLVLSVDDVGKTKKITPIPATQFNDKVEFSPEQLYDTVKAVITLTPSEINDLFHNTSLRDIFAARHTSGSIAETESETPTPDLDELIKTMY